MATVRELRRRSRGLLEAIKCRLISNKRALVGVSWLAPFAGSPEASKRRTPVLSARLVIETRLLVTSISVAVRLFLLLLSRTNAHA